MKPGESNSIARYFPSVALVLTASLLAGCTAYGGAGMSSPPPGGGASAIMNISDAPADRVIVFEVTVNAVTFVRSDDAKYSVLAGAHRVEVTHLSGTAEPLSLPNLPQGIYKSVTVDLSDPEVVYIDNAGNKVVKELPSATFSINVPLNPNVSIGNTPPVLTLDVDAAASVSIDSVTGNVTVNPALSIVQGQIGAQNEKDPEDGDFEHVIGQVTNVSANSFTISLAGSDAPVTFQTNTSTEFEGANDTSALPLGSTLRVEGHALADGTVLATEVEVLSMNGTEVEGLITATTGSPVATFDVVVQDGTGGAMDESELGSTKTVTVGNNTRFRVDSGSINLGGLNLPTFSASSLRKGQRVEVETESAQNGANFTADTVKLEQQSLVGAVTNASSSQFSLMVANDSAFNLLTGKTTLTVFTPAGTEFKNGVAVTNGAVIRLRGLVFFDPATGNYSMVASRIAIL